MKLKIFIVALVLLGFTSKAQQTDCSIKLLEAESMYENGVLDSIPSMLRSCVNEGFDNDELSRAYKLLILTYLFEDYQEMAELTMLKFLKKFPEYELKTTDPVEFTYLYKSYQTIPAFSLGVIIGGNYSSVRFIEPHGLSGPDGSPGDYTSNGMSLQGGLQIKKYITNNIDINLDLIYNLRKFEYRLDYLESKITYNENVSIFSIPLSGTYDFKLGQYSPFVRLGVNFDYLLTATADGERTSENTSINKEKLSGVDILQNRNSYSFSALVGAGLKLNLKKGYAMVDVRYHLGLMNNVNGDNRYANQDMWSKIGYVDDDFSMSNVFISAGYVFQFYQTKNK